MIKYIEELNPGNCFFYTNRYFILTTDFKKNNERLAISLDSGFSIWFKPETIIQKINLYTLDESNNIIPIKECKKDEISI